MSTSSKDQQLALRDAYQIGYDHGYQGVPRRSAVEYAKTTWPVPQITRPRIVKEHISGEACNFALVDGEFKYCFGVKTAPQYDVWQAISGGSVLAANAQRVAEAYADLKANPTELVDA